MRTLVFLVLLVLIVAPAYAVYVPSNGSIVSIAVGNSGWYNIDTSGTWRWGDGPPERYCDAEWIFYSNWEESWVEAGFGLSNDLTDLTVNGALLDWAGLKTDGSYSLHTFSESHQYRTTLYIQDSVQLQIYDTDFHDNVGGLEVTVNPVPEPSSFVALGVLLTPLLFRRRSN